MRSFHRRLLAITAGQWFGSAQCADRGVPRVRPTRLRLVSVGPSAPDQNSQADGKWNDGPQFPELLEGRSVDQPEIAEQSHHAYNDQDCRPAPVPIPSATCAHFAPSRMKG